MDKAKKFIKLWFPLILYAILIFWLSSLERPFVITPEFEHSDKLIHFLEYAVFGFILIRAIRNSDENISGNAAVLITFLIGTFYGLTDELHQSVVPGRFASVYDFIFDSIGTFVGAIVFTMRGHGKDLTV